MLAQRRRLIETQSHSIEKLTAAWSDHQDHPPLRWLLRFRTKETISTLLPPGRGRPPCLPARSNRKFTPISQILLLTSALHAATLEHMFGKPTAFRHFGCCGVIYRHDQPSKTTFKCSACWHWSDDLLDLVTDPTLKPTPDKNHNPNAPDPTSD